jgi:type II secretory pathway pseudopilin PulG
MERKNKRTGRRRVSAFTLTEVLVGVAVSGIMLISILVCITNGFASVQVNREDSRATRILLEKMEMIRLYNWSQITGNDPNTYVPASFTAPLYPDSASGSLLYTGTVSITNAPITETYASDLRLVTIGVTWTSRNVAHTRSMMTYVSKYGLQNHIY